jgi:glycine/sarcosine/betaine reductase complex component C subunit beta
MSTFPVIESAVSVLAHAPDLCRYGSKPVREIGKDQGFAARLAASLRSFEAARAYLPNRVFVGSCETDALWATPRPWWCAPSTAETRAPFGPIVSQPALYGLLKWADASGLVTLGGNAADAAARELSALEIFTSEELAAIAEGDHDVERGCRAPGTLALYDGSEPVACIRRGHDEDPSLAADVLLENLSAKATAALAVRTLLRARPDIDPAEIGYVLNSGEEAVGDRYQRGGGNLAKAVAETVGLQQCTGSDVKAFCCAPVHALVLAAALVTSGIHRRVLVVGGGSVAKLGMKSTGHMKASLPILEDVLGAFAFVVGPPSAGGARIRLDAIGRMDVRCGTAPLRIAEALLSAPLDRIGRSLLDVDRYAVELHNPEVTEPAGSGDVPRTNYRTIGSLAARRGVIPAGEIAVFERQHGLAGFAPTQGHVASAVPFLPHALRMMSERRLDTTMLIAKGSLFLGKMTNLADGISVLIERC